MTGFRFGNESVEFSSPDVFVDVASSEEALLLETVLEALASVSTVFSTSSPRELNALTALVAISTGSIFSSEGLLSQSSRILLCTFILGGRCSSNRVSMPSSS